MELEPINTSDIIRIVLGGIGLTGLYFAYSQLNQVRRTSIHNFDSTSSRFILDLYKWFVDNEKELEFFYRLDYQYSEKAFIFNPDKFPHSIDEIYLDRILYKLSYVGQLLQRGVVHKEDLGWLRFTATTVLYNNQVQSYLNWLRSPGQVPDHVDFAGAIYLISALDSVNYQKMDILHSYLEDPQ